MNVSIIHVIIKINVTLNTESHQGPYEVRLIENLLSRSQHQMLSRPVDSEDKAVEVIFGLSIQQIVSVVGLSLHFIFNCFLFEAKTCLIV